MKEMSSYTKGTISKFYNLIDKLLKLPIETYVKPWYLLLPRRQKELVLPEFSVFAFMDSKKDYSRLANSL